MINLEAYEFKRLNPDNLEDWALLIKKVINKNISKEYLINKYKTPRLPDQYFGWLAIEKKSGIVVSVSSSLPYYAVLSDGLKIPIVQMIETFTLPEHRGRGLMTYLTQKVLADHKEQGTSLFFGLLNQNNVHGFVKKLNFKHISTMQYFTINIKTFPLEAICRRLKIDLIFRYWANLILKPYLSVKSVELKNSNIEEGFGGILHDQQFFNYKTFSFNKICLFSGIKSWLKFEHGLLVGDVLLESECDDKQFEIWISKLKKIAFVMGLRKIIFQVHPETRLGIKLVKYYQPNNSWAVCSLSTDDKLWPLLEKMRYCYGDFETF